jgi:hypothetical protein
VENLNILKILNLNGIYLTIDEFKNNNPSLPLSALVNEDKEYLESLLEIGICGKREKYLEDYYFQIIKVTPA